MFQNIGKKIKAFALILFWLGVCGSVIGGIKIAVQTERFWAFLLVALVGSLVSYLSVIVLYMLGQLVDNSDIVAKNSVRQVQLLEALCRGTNGQPTGVSGGNTSAVQPQKHVCPNCGCDDVPGKFCPVCGTNLFD